MIEQTLFMAGLVVVILISVMLANRLRIAYPILLVLAGLPSALCPACRQSKSIRS